MPQHLQESERGDVDGFGVVDEVGVLHRHTHESSGRKKYNTIMGVIDPFEIVLGSLYTERNNLRRLGVQNHPPCPPPPPLFY